MDVLELLENIKRKVAAGMYTSETINLLRVVLEEFQKDKPAREVDLLFRGFAVTYICDKIDG
jgi:hypothetical protein